MSRLPGLMARASNAVTRPVVRNRHLAGVEGVRHLPATGPLIMIANHRSFADHLLLDTVLDSLRDVRTRYLTKAEAFSHPVRSRWTEGMGGIPVDRDRPGRELLATVDQVFAGGSALVIYPEGTRHSGPGLLPFKDGAFRFAVRGGLPVIPVGLWGAEDILPKGASLPRRATARIVFGPMIQPDPALTRPQRVAALTEQARDTLTALVRRAQQPTADGDRKAAAELAERADLTLETMLSRTDGLPVQRRYQQAKTLLRLAQDLDPDQLDARVTRARLTGLRALSAPAPLRPVLMRSVRHHAQEALRQDPHHLMAHYLLGRWYTMTPRALGGDPPRGLHHLREAARLGRPDTRYPMAYAEALLATGDSERAGAALREVLAAPAPDPRTEHRRLRAIAHYTALGHDVRSRTRSGGDFERLTDSVLR